MQFRRLFLTVISSFAVAAAAAAAADLVAGRDFQRLPAVQRTDSPGKVEVIEFFSFGCPHCADLNPRLEPWTAQLPADVAFKRVPVGFGRSSWANLARAYYALEATGQLGKLDQPLYDAIHKLGLQLGDESSLSAWIGRQGGDARAFSAAYRSMSVDLKARKAEEMAKNYRVMEVPTFAVDGRFVALGNSHEQILANARALAVQARSQRNASR